MGRALRRRSAFIALVVLGSLALVACGSQQTKTTTGTTSGYGGYGGSSSSASGTSTTSSTATAGAATVRLAKTGKGEILVNSRGFTVYLFTADHPGSEHCVKVSGCTSVWPPLTVSGQPTAGSGVKKSLLGTVKLPNGAHQATYAGHPLYGYANDSSPASTVYVGVTSFGGTWLAVSAAGQAVH